jgi:uncharacterized heparinase superfamily protein
LSVLTRYVNTVRYLKPVQIYGRLWARLKYSRPDLAPPPPLRKGATAWVVFTGREPRSIAPGVFRFLNVEHEVKGPSDWANSAWSKLWLYNLHYFEDLNAAGYEHRRDSHKDLIKRWITEHPPTAAPGWEPYPLSLRIVNWIKWLLAGNSPTEDMIQSLAVQTRHLSACLEFHLLGNHLIANAKALIFAGLFFRGAEADRWFTRGMSIMVHQLKEQILPDGGHFERSPMYHGLILEDLLDLINLARAFEAAIPVAWRHAPREWVEYAQRMMMWLRMMSHPDGEIALFNDAAFGVALRPSALEQYARCLQLDIAEAPISDLVHLSDSGYMRLQRGPATALLDAAPLGPDYLPAHGHADTLSFELSLFDQRVVVHSGTSCYGDGIERQQERGTAAHNTVRLDGRDSSEVWGAFRVARRARPCDVSTERTEKGLRVGACHDGYDKLPGKPRHCREWRLDEQSLRITDSIEGRGTHRIELFYHLHPDVSVEALSSKKARFFLKAERIAELELDGDVKLEIADSAYHPEFGLNIPNKKLVASGAIELPACIRTTFSWQAARHS